MSVTPEGVFLYDDEPDQRLTFRYGIQEEADGYLEMLYEKSGYHFDKRKANEYVKRTPVRGWSGLLT